MDEAEAWRPVVGYEEAYEVSSRGNVRRLPSRRLRKRVLATCGYIQFELCLNAKRRIFYAHCLVADAFLGPRPPGRLCAYLDGTRTNDSVSNLRWLTPVEIQALRILHGTDCRGDKAPNRRLSSEKVRDIRRRRAKKETLKSIAADLGVHFTTVGYVSTGKNWASVA